MGKLLVVAVTVILAAAAQEGGNDDRGSDKGEAGGDGAPQNAEGGGGAKPKKVDAPNMGKKPDVKDSNEDGQKGQTQEGGKAKKVKEPKSGGKKPETKDVDKTAGMKGAHEEKTEKPLKAGDGMTKSKAEGQESKESGQGKKGKKKSLHFLMKEEEEGGKQAGKGKGGGKARGPGADGGGAGAKDGAAEFEEVPTCPDGWEIAVPTKHCFKKAASGLTMSQAASFCLRDVDEPGSKLAEPEGTWETNHLLRSGFGNFWVGAKKVTGGKWKYLSAKGTNKTVDDGGLPPPLQAGANDTGLFCAKVRYNLAWRPTDCQGKADAVCQINATMKRVPRTGAPTRVTHKAVTTKKVEVGDGDDDSVETTAAPSGPCPEDWIHTEGVRFCYFLVKDGRSHQGAQSYCSTLGSGAMLAEPRWRVEEDFLQSKEKTGWIGLVEGERHTWRWVSGGKNVSEGDGRWAEGEPNDAAEDPNYKYPNNRPWWHPGEILFNPDIMFDHYPLERPDTERCAVLDRGGWNDGVCDDKIMFFCQMAKQ